MPDLAQGPAHTPRRNRSSLLFLTGMALVAGLAMYSDGWGRFMASTSFRAIPHDDTLPLRSGRGLTEADWDAARTAWSYFEQNYRDSSGFVDSVAGYPSGTLWDQGSYLLALISARELGLVDADLLDQRVSALLDGLGRLELFEGKLPNKVYHSVTLQQVDYTNKHTAEGVGWSALDIGRMLSALRILETRHPAYATRIRAVLAGWNLDAMAFGGQLQGAARTKGRTDLRQEGRIGYEQYAARAAAMWGLDVITAATAAPIMEWETIASVEVPVDRRKASSFRAITPTLSEPFLLQGLELGFNAETATLAQRVYAAQEARYRRTGTLTMVSEGNINQPPYFLYASVYANGEPWAVVTEKGAHHPDLRTVSLKAAFAWNALYDTEYTRQVLDSLQDLKTDRGWASGRYEASGEINTVVTANTNAVVLEALHFKHSGPLLDF